MRTDDFDRLTAIAECVSTQLVSALREGLIAKIDMDLIKRELRRHSKFPKDFVLYTRLEDMTVRKVVELAALHGEAKENVTVNPEHEQHRKQNT